MKQTVFSKPLKFNDVYPSSVADDCIRVTRDGDTVVKVELLTKAGWTQVTEDVDPQEEARKLLESGDKIQLGTFTGNSIGTLGAQVPDSVLKSGSNEIEVVSSSDVDFIDDYAFNGCESLTKFTITSNIERVGGYAFSNCPNLKEVFIEDGSYDTIGQCIFGDEQGPKQTKTDLILLTENVLSLDDSEYLSYGTVTGIYVLDDLVDDYQEATNWSDFADIIHPMSDIKLDKTKLCAIGDSADFEINLTSHIGDVEVTAVTADSETVGVSFEGNKITLHVENGESDLSELEIDYNIGELDYTATKAIEASVVDTPLEYVDIVGAGIIDTDGLIYISKKEWEDADKPEVQGILISDGTHRYILSTKFIRSVNYEGGHNLYEYYGAYNQDSTVTGLTDYDGTAGSGEADDPLTDFDGASNTAKFVTFEEGVRAGTITLDDDDPWKTLAEDSSYTGPLTAPGLCAAYEFPDGSNGYMWSAGEENICVEHKDLVNDLLHAVGGDSNWLVEYVWSSTSCSALSSWFYFFGNSSWSNYGRYYYVYVVPVCAFTPSV